MAHEISPRAEALLDQEFPVHNYGFVRLVDYLGNDARIVQAARTSYAKNEVEHTPDQDRALIDHLFRNHHTSPFEQVEFVFHLKMPIFVARQWIRHRMASLNEISGRYSVMKDEFYVPAAEDVKFQAKDNKQGRAADDVDAGLAALVCQRMTDQQEQAYEEYADYLEVGLAKELARVNLPLSLYTEMYWKIDLHNLMHFLGLRMDAHAQKEIRDFAHVVYNLAETVAPMAVKAFDDHQRYAVSFSRKEIQAVRAMLAGNPAAIACEEMGAKERERFELKLKEGRQT